MLSEIRFCWRKMLQLSSSLTQTIETIGPDPTRPDPTNGCPPHTHITLRSAQQHHSYRGDIIYV